MGLAEKCSNLT